MLDLFGCCRLCLKQDETVIVNCTEIEELRKTVEEVFGFKITFSDKCTTKLCKDCIHKVTSFAMYRDTVLNNQKSLEQYIILNEKLTINSEVKAEDDSDVIVIESIDEKPPDSPDISNDKMSEISAPKSPSSEDDIPLMKLICSQETPDFEKENINDTIEKSKTIYKNPCTATATSRPNYIKINLKHFKSAKVKIHRLNETNLRRLSKSYNQLKLQEESNASQPKHITPIQEAASTHLINSKLHNEGEVQPSAIVAQLLSAVNKHENPSNIINGEKTPNNAQLKSGVFIVENDRKSTRPLNKTVCSSVENSKGKNSYVNSIVNKFLINRMAQNNLINNKNETNPINDSNANEFSDKVYLHTKPKQTPPKAIIKIKETNEKLPGDRKRKLISVGQLRSRALPKISPTVINEKIMLVVKNENKHSASASTHPLPLSVSKDKSPNRIESIDLTEPTAVDSGSNRIFIWQNQSANSASHLSDKTTNKMEYLLDHTYNRIKQQLQVQQSKVSPHYSLQQPSIIESKKATEPMQLQVQAKPPTSAQSSTISNKTAIPNTHTVNNPAITIQTLPEQQLIACKPSNIQSKETEPVQRHIRPTIAQDSIMTNKAAISYAPVKSTLTHTPQHFPEKRVKVLTVNELNMKAAKFSRNESPPRKLPIRITLVKIQNEVQIKLTDSNNKDISFGDLTLAEKQAVKSSLIEPACKEQILAAIKTCNPDQYSANMLRCVGLTQREMS